MPTWKFPKQQQMGGVLDVVGALAVNFGASHMASAQPNLRWIPWGKTDNAYLDARLIGGIASLGASMWGGPVWGRVGQDVAQGLLGSFVATERVRAASIARMQQQQIPASTPAQAAPATAPPWGTPAPATLPTPPAPAPALPPPAAPAPAATTPLAANITAATQAAKTLMSGSFR